MNTRSFVTSLVICALYLTYATPALAGGWTQAPGAYYGKLWQRTIVGNKGISKSGDTVEHPQAYTDTSLNFYGEYGVTKSFTAIVAGTPVGWASVDTSSTYVGPLSIGARAGTKLGGAHVALEGTYGYASGIGEKNLVTSADYEYVPTVATHRADLALQLGYGLSFGWFAASAGVRGFSRALFDPTALVSAQLGGNVGQDWTLEGHTQLHQPMGKINANNISGAGETRYVGIGFSASYWFHDMWAMTASLEGAPYFLANAATPSLIVGVETRSR